MSRTSPSFLQLLRYVAGEGRAVGEPLLHNLSGDGRDFPALNRAFLANYRHCPARRNGVALYHEVLSFSPADAAALNPEILRDLAATYLARRAPQALAYGVIHGDKNPHVHLIISGNLRGRARKLRLSRSEFAAVKRQLEAYQRAQYPALEHSLVFAEAPPPGKPPPTRAEQEQARRERRPGRALSDRKQRLQHDLLTNLRAATSWAAFAEALRAQDIQLYERRGRVVGVFTGGRKYRFRTLGVAEAFSEAQARWQRGPERRQGLFRLQAEKIRQWWRVRSGVPERLHGVLVDQAGCRGREAELAALRARKAAPERGLE